MFTFSRRWLLSSIAVLALTACSPDKPKFNGIDVTGADYAKGHGVEMIAFPEAEQAKLDALYNRFAVKQAKDLSALGLDGMPVFEEAQRLIAGSSIACRNANPGVVK